jgi:hypothetical protein
MDYLPNLSRKYNLNEVSEFYYEESFANAVINNFEDEDIQLSSGTLENDYVFTVHPTRGIDIPSSTNFFTYSRVFDSDLNTLLFSLPGSSSIKTVGEMDYRIQQQFGEQPESTNKILVFKSGDQYIRFIGGESSTVGKVDSNDLIEHYTLIHDGAIVDLTDGNYSIVTNNYSSTNSDSTVTITRNTGNWNLNSISLICNMNVNPYPSGGIRNKIMTRATDSDIVLKKTKDGIWKIFSWLIPIQICYDKLI